MSEKDYMTRLRESADYIASKIGGFKPEILITLGSGLASLADLVENPTVVSYRDIPNFPVSTAPGHDGAFYFGKLAGKNVMLMKGRCHCYEGYDMQTVVFPLRTARLLGVDKAILTNAAGAVNTNFHVGDLMLITDHIKLWPESPLRGENIDELGIRFPDMLHAYHPDFQAIARNVAHECAITLREGVYMFFGGPQYETPAEIRAARTLGADAVGMSTVPETIAANHCGMKVLGVSLMTNMAAGIEKRQFVDGEVLEEGLKAQPRFTKFILGCLEKM